jgi:excisionase family DNA binding protein
MDKFVSRKEVLKVLGVHYHTLYRMIERKEIEYIDIGNKFLFNLDKYMRDKGVNNKIKKKICYCRVSSQKQKEDLERQIEFMKEKYPGYEIISDIGSSLNLNRKGLVKILDMAIEGEIDELVIAYKDRLARFGFDMIENLIHKYSKGKIIIVNREKEKTPMEEVSEDIISIMNVYVAKINGLRKYKTQMEKDLFKIPDERNERNESEVES